MANTRQAKKRARQSEDRRIHNSGLRSTLRTSVKKVLKAIQAGDKENARAAFRSAEPVIDRIADKGLIHKNKAARHKSRLSARLKAM